MNASLLSDPPPHRTASLAQWRVAEAFMHILHALFGGPEQVAARHTLRAAAHKLMASWLRAGEAMMRRLLIIEAAAYPKPNTRALLWPKRQRLRRLRAFAPDEPQAWRVSLRYFKTADRRLPAGTSANPFTVAAGRTLACRLEAGGPKRFYSAWPLAERYEALLRVFNDPTAAARRLAKRLHATPHRLRAMLRAPPEAEHRIDGFAALTESAETAAANFNTS